VPTLAEQGLKGFDVSTWLAMLAPAKTSAPIVTRLNKELVRILALPDVQEKLMSEGGEVTPTSPEEAAAFIRSEVAKWGKALKGANIPVE
jgi:tripartite-type tricarboxylate transporter receptor subunit TctC